MLGLNSDCGQPVDDPYYHAVGWTMVLDVYVGTQLLMNMAALGR